MEAIQHGHLLHPGIITGDDEMMDSDYDQAIQQDDDYDIELDGAEVYSNAGDEEMKFDMGEEAITYDNDDVMLDEGEYQTTIIQEEMVITEVPPVSAPFSSIEMSTTTATEIDHTHSSELPNTQTLSQSSTQDIHTDLFVLSQHAPGVVVEVPNSPVVDPQVQKVQPDTAEIAENTQQEQHILTQEDVINSSNDNQSGQLISKFSSTDKGKQHQVGLDGEASVESSAQSETVLILEKIHPIVVQFESNTLALFNSEHYLNLSALDNRQSTYPEVPSVFLLQDVSFYSKGFDELFGALREMFGASIGDDAEITMEFVGLELFLHEDNLLSKSISLSDLMDLHIRLSKQDGAERPDPLYIVLSTQARFTKRYSELLTAAGEGKGLSQICTFNPANDLSTASDLPQSPESPSLATKDISAQDNNEPQESDQPVTASEPEDRNVNAQKAEDVSPSQQPQEKRESVEIAVDVQEPVEVVVQEYEEAGQASTEEDSEDEEELLPAEGEEEQRNNNAISEHLHIKSPQEEVAEKRPNEMPPIKNIEPMTRSVNKTGVEGVIEEAAPETTQPEEEFEPDKEQNFGEEGTGEQPADAKVEEEEELKLEEEVIAEGSVNGPPRDENPSQEESSTKVGVSSEDTLGDFAAEEERQYQRVQDGPAIVDTVYNNRTQSFAAEELLDYEEEEGESSPFSEIPDEEGQTGEEGHDLTHATNDEEDAEQSPATASHETEIAGHPDEDGFSSTTIVDARDVYSPVPHSLSHSGTGGSQSPPEIDTEQHHIQVYQYEEETSADFNDAEQGEEVEDLEAYAVQGSYEYHEGPWGGDESGDFLQEESYYTAVVDLEEYDPGQYEENPNTVLIHDGETGEGSTGEPHEEDEENIDYLDEEGYNDEGAYHEFPGDAEEEVTEYDASRGDKSPIAKRHREEEADVLDVQDIKRTRST
ncbi:hypothetical protein BGX38DRAFT_1269663 [Terfezia claveryi]|nr:hypothetical protein BGX38DRAFT_1269663 [Terfezia claveryi]